MQINIAGRKVGGGAKTLIIAELSCNHDQKLEVALKTIKAIKEAGADAVKLQTYTPDTLTINCRNRYFRIKGGTLWDGATLYDLYKKAFTPWEWHDRLQREAKREGLIFFSTPFDRTAVDFLEKLKVPAYKVASFEITDIPLIEYIASKGKPLIISTGIAELAQVRDALAACRRAGNRQVILLKCTSEYPALFEDMNLRVIPDMAARFKCLVGLSDHSPGASAPVAAVALGACAVEKHFILDRTVGGPDAKFSLDRDEFALMTRAVREAEAALGEPTYRLPENVKKSRIFARSLFVVKDVGAGERFTAENVRSIRPGYGLSPKHYRSVLGRRAARRIKAGTPLTEGLVEGGLK